MSVDFPDWVNAAPATDPKLIKQQLFDLERRMSLYQQMGAEFPKSLTWELLSCTKSLLKNLEEEDYWDTLTMRLKTRDLVDYLIQRDGLLCHFPGCKHPKVFKGYDDISIDHWIPKSRGGTDHTNNLKLMHVKCNNAKSNRLVLPDGTLEVRPAKTAKKAKAARKKPCEKCWEGRNLGPDDVCAICGMTAMPQPWPRYKQRTPKECDHNIYFCWSCTLGFAPREEVAVDIGLVTDIDDEIKVLE